MAIEYASAAVDTGVAEQGFELFEEAPGDSVTSALGEGGGVTEEPRPADRGHVEVAEDEGSRLSEVTGLSSVNGSAAVQRLVESEVSAPDAAEVADTADAGTAGRAPEMEVEPAGDVAEDDGDTVGYGTFDERADPAGGVATPHIDRATALMAQDRRYNAGFADSPIKHVALTFGAGLASGLVIMGVASGGNGPSAFEGNTQKVAAAAEYPGGAPAAATTTATAEKALNTEAIPPAANSGQNADVNHLIQTAEVQGVTNMNGSPNGIPPKDWAEVAFATDQISHVPVPAAGREAMAAAELAGGTDNKDYMAAADSAFGAALNAADNDHTTIDVPISGNNNG